MKAILIPLSILIFFDTYGQTGELRITHFNVKNGIAIQGYDPVSYFDSKPQEGSEKFKLVYKGITYQFVNPNNRGKFKANPENYEPAYGGWCAYAMGASGEKVKIDPETYTIENGKLYLFYNFWGNNTLEGWNKEEKKLRESADRSWKNIFR